MSCKIARCERDRKGGSSLCSMHEKRKQRWGSPTARACFKCKSVVDDDHSAESQDNRSWLCNGCLIKPSRFTPRRMKNHVVTAHLRLDQVKWMCQQMVRDGKQTSQFIRDLFDAAMRGTEKAK